MRNRVLLVLTVFATLITTGCSSASTGPIPIAGEIEGPANVDAAPGATIRVVAREWRLTPVTITAGSGPRDIELLNQGTIEHELIILRTDTAFDQLVVGDNNRVDEEASIGEVAEIPAGERATETFELEPGNYVYFCNIAGHYAKGMRGSLVVN